MSRILITGASGLLGLNFGLIMSKQHEVFGVVNQNLLHGVPFNVIQADLIKDDMAVSLLDRIQPEVIIHCAAMANIDQCESNQDLAFQINALLPEKMALAARRLGIRLVHISTDAVFDGQRGNYHETDQTNPLSVYALTKLQGEQRVADTYPEAIISRVNFYGWSLTGKRSLGEFFYTNLKSGARVKGFTDVYFCPLEVTYLIELLMKMVQGGISGLYHVVSSQAISKYDFGCNIADQFGFDKTLISPASWKDSGLIAARSPNLTLDVSKLTRSLGENLPEQQPGLARFRSQATQGYPDQIQSYKKGD